MLKLLHTADWHLGHSLHGVTRHKEHQYFLSWLLQELLTKQINVLIVAGDIFDSANPTAQAQTQLYEFLVHAKRQQEKLTIILIGGNHDSASRLDAPSSLLNTLGIHVVGGLNRQNGEIEWNKLLIPLKNNNGDIEAWCGAMPFLRNADMPNCDISPQSPLIDGVSKLYAQLFSALQQKALNDEAVVLTGHCYMVGGQISELSERKILGGNQHALPVDLFPDEVAYVALGHLHNPQAVGSKAHIRYSGSPIPLSFDESHYVHQIVQVELNGKQPAIITTIPVPRAIDLIRLPNAQDFAPLSDILMQLQTLPLNYRLEREAYPFVELRILLHKPEPSLHQQIDAAVAQLPLRILKRSIAMTGSNGSLADMTSEERLEELQPLAVFERCYHSEYGVASCEKLIELTHLFTELLEDVQQIA